jgi:Uma2 family endonuclease
MPPQKEPHTMSILLCERALRKAFGPDYVVRTQMPLSASAKSEPEPDLAVVRGTIREMTKHPTTALLVIEIADATLEFDRDRKSGLYAQCKVADYWIVNLRDRQLEVRREIVANRRNEFGWDYSQTDVYQTGAAVAPLARPRTKIKVADLLP